MVNRFDMESQIMAVWSMCEELDTLLEGVLEKDMSKDEISNALLGLRVMHHLKSEKLFDTFSEMITKGKVK